MTPLPPRPTLFPYTTLFRSHSQGPCSPALVANSTGRPGVEGDPRSAPAIEEERLAARSCHLLGRRQHRPAAQALARTRRPRALGGTHQVALGRPVASRVEQDVVLPPTDQRRV